MGKVILAFDLYGTLLSTASISAKLAVYYGSEKAEAMATTWRKYQLEYTWRLNSMKQYQDFEVVTRKSLLHTLTEFGVTIEDEHVASVIAAYDNLEPFVDVVPALKALQGSMDLECVIFSNGNRQMLNNSVRGSPGLSLVHETFSKLISVDPLQSYKPAPEVYRYLANCVGMVGQESSLWLISSNAFDIVGARNMGLKAVWVDRVGKGWQDKLGPEPTEIVRRLGEVVQLVNKLNG